MKQDHLLVKPNLSTVTCLTLKQFEEEKYYPANYSLTNHCRCVYIYIYPLDKQ